MAVVAEEEDLGFLDLEPEAVGAGFRFELEAAADVEANMVTRCLKAAGGGGEVTKGEVWYEKKAGAQGEFRKARRIARQTKFPTSWKIYAGGPWCIRNAYIIIIQPSLASCPHAIHFRAVVELTDVYSACNEWY